MNRRATDEPDADHSSERTSNGNGLTKWATRIVFAAITGALAYLLAEDRSDIRTLARAAHALSVSNDKELAVHANQIEALRGELQALKTGQGEILMIVKRIDEQRGKR